MQIICCHISELRFLYKFKLIKIDEVRWNLIVLDLYPVHQSDKAI